eukprot:SAG11_NODE_2121_length_3790_cov_3.824709_4_plen_84_part_00
MLNANEEEAATDLFKEMLEVDQVRRHASAWIAGPVLSFFAAAALPWLYRDSNISLIPLAAVCRLSQPRMFGRVCTLQVLMKKR